MKSEIGRLKEEVKREREKGELLRRGLEDVRSRVWDSGYRVWGLGFGVWQLLRKGLEGVRIMVFVTPSLCLVSWFLKFGFGGRPDGEGP
jgi:hypothetical protein